MRIYYHLYPTCPACHEPHVSGSSLEIEDSDLKCSSCGAHFRKGVDLVLSGKFSKTIDAVTRSEGEKAKNKLRGSRSRGRSDRILWSANISAG